MTIQAYEPTELVLSTAQDVAVQRLGEWASSADAAYRIAERLSTSAFVPAQFRDKPVELTAAILSGLEVGISPMAAMRSFDIISGQAAPRAMTLRAIVQSHGHEMVLVESTATRCVMKGRRRGSDQWQTVTWTMDRAGALGLIGKDNWKKQPAAMLVARASSELARLIASDAILGIAYSVEELTDGGGFDEPTAEPAASSGTRRMSRARPPTSDSPPATVEAPSDAPAAEVEGEAGEVPETPSPATPPDPDVDMVTGPQLKNIGRLCGLLGLTERKAALAYVADVIGREVGSRNELTRDEASRLIDTMAAEADIAEAGQ